MKTSLEVAIVFPHRQIGLLDFSLAHSFSSLPPPLLPLLMHLGFRIGGVLKRVLAEDPNDEVQEPVGREEGKDGPVKGQSRAGLRGRVHDALR